MYFFSKADIYNTDTSGERIGSTSKRILDQNDENTFVLRIGFYSDEFETCNPIGSKAKLHKLYGFYYTINNLGIIGRESKILTYSIIKSKFVKKYGGINIVQQRFVKEMKVLENGINFYFGAAKYKLIFRLAYITGTLMKF